MVYVCNTMQLLWPQVVITHCAQIQAKLMYMHVCMCVCVHARAHVHLFLCADVCLLVVAWQPNFL